MNTPAAESLESQVKTLNERQQGWDQVLRFRVSGFEKLSNRCHEISRGSREFWRLKHEVGDLMLHSLGPDLFGPNDAKIKGELAECLQEPWLLGVFPVGGRWPDEKSIEIRMRPSLAAFRLQALVKGHLSPKLKQREDLTMKCWIPLTHVELQRKAKRDVNGNRRHRSRSRR